MSDANSPKFRFPQVYIVEASAGSGKTYALARRYVQLLINPTLGLDEFPLENILAITFTNKATQEMKGRILALLKRIALDKFPDEAEKEGILSELEVDFGTAQKKALRIMDKLIVNYNFFQVQTIHSFINAILSACALRLGLSAEFRIRTDAAAYLAYSLDDLVDAAARDKDTRDAFHRFLKQYLFLENRTGWFPKENILEEVAKIFAKMNRYGKDLMPGRGDAKTLAAGKKKLLAKMRQLKEAWPVGAHRSFEKKFMEFIEGNVEGFNFDDLSTYFAREEFSITKAGNVSGRVARLWLAIRSDLASLADEESALLMNPYLDIFTRVFKNFKALAAKDDCLFLDELNRQARFLFDEELLTVPELYYRLAMRLKHILIDEFQDTSPLEWENIDPMVEEVLATDGSLFYVGDKKQAIYRFKGGDPTLFDRVKEQFRDRNLIEGRLSHNRRSQKEIVGFANDVFSEANLRGFLRKCEELKKEDMEFAPSEEETVLKVFEAARQEHMASKDNGYVCLETFEVANKEDRNRQIKERLLPLIKGLSGRHGYGDIALLVRRNEDAELLTEWLVEDNIPVESERSLNIRNHAFIKELVSFLKFLNSPIDNLSFASFITGDIFLRASGQKPEDVHDFIFSLREKGQREKAVYFYREFRRRYPKVWESHFEEFFKNVGFVPPYELTVSILRAFDCFAFFGDAQGFFMRFLELIKEQEKENNSLALFLEFFEEASGEELYVRVSKADAVKVLTIHKAKGLGFGVVILPFLEMEAEVEPVVTRYVEGHPVLLRLNKKYREFSSVLDAIYREEHLKSFIDELNGIYVALTRAKEELYCFLPRGAKRNSLAAELLCCDGRTQRGELPRSPQKGLGKKEDLVVDLPASSYVDWIGFLARFLNNEFKEASVLANRKKILRGEIFHYILSFIGDLSRQAPGLALKEGIKQARHKFPDRFVAKDYEAVLRKLFDDTRFSPFFFTNGLEVLREKEVVDDHGNTKRIDRLIVAKDEVCVIDYKTSLEKNAKDKEQVAEYMALIGEVYPAKKVRGVLIYLDSLELESVA